MPFSDEDIRKNSDYFRDKLRANMQRSEVLQAVEQGRYDFVLLDTRPREAYAKGHIPGAWSAPPVELERVLPLLPRDQQLVTYCWGHD